MGNDLDIQWNGTSITPTPVLSQSFEFVDTPSRWGNIVQLELKGLYTGITSTGNVNNLVNIFAGNFGTLTVNELNVGTIYSWNNAYVSDILFNPNSYLVNSFVPYSIKIRSMAGLPSGITDPVNEYVFTQGEDSIVTLTHKTSARGIKNINGALNNAISFVKNFTGQNPFSSAFIPAGSPILMSLSETINRAEAVYTVLETYKYITGSTNIYMDTFMLDISDIIENEFLTMDASLKLQGSPVNNNLSSIESSLPSLFTYISSVGIITGNLYINSYNVVRNTGDASINIKSSFISGYSATDVQGYLDYNVSLDFDRILPKQEWRIEGEWVCKGPVEYRIQQLNIFKSTNETNWRGYLAGLVNTSPIYSGYANGYGLEITPTIDIQEVTGIGIFKISTIFSDLQYPSTLDDPKYTVESSPSKWNFELLPAANIEGLYVVQDPQMRTQSQVSISVEAEAQKISAVVSLISGYVTSLSNIYVPNAHLKGQFLTTGFTNITFKEDWLGNDTISSGMLYNKIVGSQSSNYVRAAGYSFGF